MNRLLVALLAAASCIGMAQARSAAPSEAQAFNVESGRRERTLARSGIGRRARCTGGTRRRRLAAPIPA
jgi:hypothetical protein